jgi:hypothetical protein
MDSIVSAFPDLIPYGILLALAVILVSGLMLFREREQTGALAKDRWRCWARRTVVIQVVFFLLYPAFITDGFTALAVPVCLVPIAWGFYTYFSYRTRGEHWVSFVGAALSVFWIYFAWDSNIRFLFVRR